MRLLRPSLVLILGAGLLMLAAPAQAARRQVPRGYMGMDVDGPVFTPPSDLSGEFSKMVGAGVESVRATFDWAQEQPYASFSQVPAGQQGRFRDVGGVPTDFSSSDMVVREAALRRLNVLPVIFQAPNWAARHRDRFATPPSDFGAYARFAAALAERYGPNGSFWAENPGLPRLPIRYWQIWNEPSFKEFWSDHPWVADYVELVRQSRAALKSVDPHAKVVLGGLPYTSWVWLRQVYAAGARRLFDVVAIHPFTKRIVDLVLILRRNRRVMRRHHDSRKPLWVTELSWPSAKGKINVNYGYNVTERDQARRIEQAIPTLVRRRRDLAVGRVYWYNWMTAETRRDYPFDYAGLRRWTPQGIVSKPSFYAYRRTALRLEGCRSKGSTATRCRR